MGRVWAQGVTKPAVLYISYDGMLEPLGQSQVIAYLERLTDLARIHVLSFEKPSDRVDGTKVMAIADRLAAAGIHWHPLTYHKSPSLPATFYDIAQGTIVALWLTLRHNASLIHARSYIPALIGRILKAVTGAKLLFDIRGLWADERVDGGLWPPSGRVYRAVKRLEKALFLGADHIITLTEASRSEIEHFSYMASRSHAPISVITTCADLDRFHLEPDRRQDAFVLGYVGAVGTWHRFDDVLACFVELQRHRPEARLLVVNRNEHEVVKAALDRSNLPDDCVELVAADFAAMPSIIAQMSAGAAIRMATYSQIACAPTKVAEYLGCGIPCIANRGVGDVTQILEESRVGVVLRDFSEVERRRAVIELLALCEEPGIAQRCREVAERRFSLEGGVAEYGAIYRTLLGDSDGDKPAQ